MKKIQHIFIDGPDGCGKTTIVKMLSKELNLPIIKMPSAAKAFRRGDIEEISYVFNKVLEQFSEYSFIVDRGFTSSIVYSKVFNRKIDLSYLEETKQKLNPIIITLTADNQILFERRKSDQVIDNDKRLLIKTTYEETSKANGWYLIETSDKSIRNVFNEVLKIIKDSI